MTAGQGEVPVERKRPADRRQQILSAAGALYRGSGFHNTSMSDVAASVGITAPALYRHFRNKQDLLGEVVSQGLAMLSERVQAATDLDELIDALVVWASDRRGLTVLWQREGRHLSAARREEHRQTFNQIIDVIAGHIAERRPDSPEAARFLLASALISVFGSVAALSGAMPRRRLEAVLRRSAHHVAGCTLGAIGGAQRVAAAGGDEFALSRREQVLNTAIRLMDERGFRSVTTDDIGEALGTSGPGIYKHFPRKTDLLLMAFVRGGERRHTCTVQALADAAGPRDAQRRLVRSYIEFALENSRLIGLMLSEVEELPEQDRKRAVQGQREFLAVWHRTLERASDGLDPVDVKVVVAAVLHVIDNAVRTRHLAERAGLAERLEEICEALLAVEPGRARPVG